MRCDAPASPTDEATHCATRWRADLVNSGGSIKEVADVLRHRSMNTSLIYAKLDQQRLAEVALPWFGSAA
jgi:site-specific recombinase XerC